MGGFASGPGGLMAWLIRKPLVVHEQNAIPGLTNKVLAQLATVVLQAFPDVFKQGLVTGNPVRQSICEIKKPEERGVIGSVDNSGVNTGEARLGGIQLGETQQRNLRLLIIGGSLGAVKLNEVVPQALAKIEASLRPEVVHQTGLKNIEQAKNLYDSANVDAKVEAFIDDMPSVYEWADLVICRAGAMTVFELAAVGVASILVPYPYAVDDHQTHNAHYLEQAGAAIIRQQDDLSADWLADVINDFSVNREKLFGMAVAARKLAIPGSAKKIADICLTAGGVA
jgi:UDP-N-acetylglucosamine--N-acetylmuramyl-(pentapeptide) pyrophosphoryl-undecaprenol N-acetylglucosamine transferase